MPKSIVKITFKKVLDKDPDLSYLGSYSNLPEEHHIDRVKRRDAERFEYRYFNLGCGDPDYLERDYKRMEAYNKGDWYMLHVCCEAEIEVNGISQRIYSGGLGGVESDSGKDHFEEIKGEELKDLSSQLEELGFLPEEIKDSIIDMEETE